MKRRRSLFALFLSSCLLTDPALAITQHSFSQASESAFHEQALMLQIGSAEHDMDVPARDTIGFRRFISGMSAWWGRFSSEAGSVPTHKELTPGQYLKMLMDSQGITQTELSIRTKLSQPTISLYQRDVFLPSQENAELMMKELNSSFTYFWNEIVTPYAKRNNKPLVLKKRLGNRILRGPEIIVLDIVLPNMDPVVDDVSAETAWFSYRSMIGARISKRRTDLHWTQQDLAKKSHIPQNSLSILEKTLSDSNVDGFLAVAKGLGLATEALLDPRPTLEPEATLPPHDVTLAQIHLNFRQLVRQNHDLDNPRVRYVLHILKTRGTIQLKLLYFYTIRPLADKRMLPDLFKTSLKTPPQEGSIRKYTDEEEKFYKALKNQNGSRTALRLTLAFRMLEQQFPHLAQVLTLYLLKEDDLSLAKIGRLLDPKRIVSAERVRQLKIQAFTFLTVVTIESLKPLMSISLMNFEPFGLKFRLRRELDSMHIRTLSDLLAAEKTDRLAQIKKPAYLSPIIESIAALKAAVNSAPQIPPGSGRTSA